jgi:LmbE family N-acetylglucosaminyl deacetylase
MACVRALFVFAHQDDEYAAAPWIIQERDAGATIACVYLTNGGFRVKPAVRDAESLAVLRSFRIDASSVAFLETEDGRIADRALAARATDGLQALERRLVRAAFVPTRIYAPSYEGGHPDHDAAHLIAAVVAARLGVLDDAWHFSLYNAYRCRRPLFSTLKQLPSDAPAREPAWPLHTRLAMTMLCWRYRSQRRTWMGLFPGAFVERAVLNRERLLGFDVSRLVARPHEGELLYERLFATPYDDFAGAVAPIRALLATAAKPPDYDGSHSRSSR